MVCRVILIFLLSVGVYGAISGSVLDQTNKKSAIPTKKAISQKPAGASSVAATLTLTPTPVPCATPTYTPAPSINPWVQPIIGTAQIVVTAILAFVLWRLSFFAFVRTSEQKINERQGIWFHKVVVDPQLDNLNKFVESANRLLIESAQSCETAKAAADIPELERRVEIAISAFNDLLLPVQRSLSDMVTCFDQEQATECTERCGRLQDEVTTWFERLLQQADVDTTVSLPGLVSIFRSDILSRLRNYEFATYGFERGGLVSHILGW